VKYETGGHRAEWPNNNNTTRHKTLCNPRALLEQYASLHPFCLDKSSALGDFAYLNAFLVSFEKRLSGAQVDLSFSLKA
jgi:hypothetical protein